MAHPPKTPLDDLAAASVCSDTVNGWLWYCDEHDTHGNADSEDEAGYMAHAHSDYHLDPQDGDGDPCDVIVWPRREASPGQR